MADAMRAMAQEGDDLRRKQREYLFPNVVTGIGRSARWEDEGPLLKLRKGGQ